MSGPADIQRFPTSLATASSPGAVPHLPLTPTEAGTTAAAIAALGNDCLINGTNLTDADETINPASVAKSRFVMPASTATAARVKTMGTTGSPMTLGTSVLRIEVQGYTVTVRNGGTNGTAIADYVLAANQATAVDLVVQYDGTDWSVIAAYRVQ